MVDEVNKTVVSENPAVETAKAQEAVLDETQITTLSTGVRARLSSVSASLISEVRERIKDPEVPIMRDEEKDRDMPNPNHPSYLRELDRADEARNLAVTDAMLVFGVELVDPLPDDDTWIRQLQFLNIEVDVSDHLAKEFAYKKYVAVGAQDLPKVYSASAPVSSEEVAKAMNSFPDDSEGDSSGQTADA